ncbi:MAG: Arm DNA-binding domain-containing protein [Pseudomonadota bacterium]
MAQGPHPRDKLTAATARRLGPGKHADGGGLYLQVDDSGARRWVFRTTHHGRRREFALDRSHSTAWLRPARWPVR